MTDDLPLDVLALYTIGFLVHGQDEIGTAWLAAGSGVLVQLDGIKGIITAAHVIRVLRDCRTIGLFTVAAPSNQRAPHLEFLASEIRSVTIGDQDAPDGPDMGFVRLPLRIEQQLAVRNTFYNFNIRQRGAASATAPLVGDVIAGVVGEKVRLKEFVAGERRVDERTLDIAPGTVSNEKIGGAGFDIFDFTINHDGNVSKPDTYKGLSGSAVWRVGETMGVHERLLAGIAFYESDQGGGGPITCHGPEGIYGRLADAIRAAMKSGTLN